MLTRAVGLAALLTVWAGAAAPAGAKIYRASGFHITAPAGFRLTQPAPGVHALTCGSAARVGFARWHGSSSPLAVARTLSTQAGMSILRTSSTRTKASVTLSGTDSKLHARHGGAVATKSGRTITARFWRQTTKGTGCGAAGARAASLLDDLARAAASADGGGLADINLKAITTLENPPVSMTRYEVCAQTNGSGQPPCTSALVPDAWFPNLAASPGFI